MSHPPIFSQLSFDIRQLLWQDYLRPNSISLALLKCTNKSMRRELARFDNQISARMLDGCSLATIHQVLPDVFCNPLDALHWIRLVHNAATFKQFDDVTRLFATPHFQQLNRVIARLSATKQANLLLVSLRRQRFEALKTLCRSLHGEPQELKIINNILATLDEEGRKRLLVAAIVTGNKTVISESHMDKNGKSMLKFEFFPLFASEIPDYETCKHLLNIIHPPHHEQYTLDSIKVMLACKHFVYTLAADSSLMEKYLDISDLDYIHRLCYAAFHFKQYAIVKKLASSYPALLPTFATYAIQAADHTAIATIQEYTPIHTSLIQNKTNCRHNLFAKALANGVEDAQYFLDIFFDILEQCNCFGTPTCTFCSTLSRLLNANIADTPRLLFLYKRIDCMPDKTKQWAILRSMLKVVVGFGKFLEPLAYDIFQRLQFESAEKREHFANHLAAVSQSEVAFDWVIDCFELNVTPERANQILQLTCEPLKRICMPAVKKCIQLGANIVPYLAPVEYGRDECTRLGLLHIPDLPVDLQKHLIDIYKLLTDRQRLVVIMALIVNGQVRVIRRIFPTMIQNNLYIRQSLTCAFAFYVPSKLPNGDLSYPFIAHHVQARTMCLLKKKLAP